MTDAFLDSLCVPPPAKVPRVDRFLVDRTKVRAWMNAPRDPVFPLPNVCYAEEVERVFSKPVEQVEKDEPGAPEAMARLAQGPDVVYSTLKTGQRALGLMHLCMEMCPDKSFGAWFEIHPYGRVFRDMVYDLPMELGAWGVNALPSAFDEYTNEPEWKPFVTVMEAAVANAKSLYFEWRKLAIMQGTTHALNLARRRASVFEVASKQLEELRQTVASSMEDPKALETAIGQVERWKASIPGLLKQAEEREREARCKQIWHGLKSSPSKMTFVMNNFSPYIVMESLGSDLFNVSTTVSAEEAVPMSIVEKQLFLQPDGTWKSMTECTVPTVCWFKSQFGYALPDPDSTKKIMLMPFTVHNCHRSMDELILDGAIIVANQPWSK